jgi:hypothetical protein
VSRGIYVAPLLVVAVCLVLAALWLVFGKPPEELQ